MSPVRSPFLILVFLFLICVAGGLQAQILNQDFDALLQIEEFEGTPPDQGQVDTINLRPVDELPVFSIASDEEGRHLLVEKRGNSMRHFSRKTGFEDADLLKVQFSFTGGSGTSAGKVLALFLGKELGNSSFTPNRASRWAQLLIMRNEDGTWFIQNEVGGNIPNGATFPFSPGETVTITVIANNSGGNVLYEAPNGGPFNIEHQKVDVWVDNVPIINNADAYTGATADLSEVKFLTWNTSLSASLQIDDLLLEEIEYESLPVGLVHFSASPYQKHVKLRWETGWERNSSHFEVERSLEGKHFDSIGQVKAVGESAQLRVYEFVDENALEELAGKVYYRLRQVDIDGTFSYSAVQVVDLPAQPIKLIGIGPNPFSDQLRIQVHSTQARIFRLRLLNSQGVSVLEQEFRVPRGAENELIFLQLSQQLKAGMYIMEVYSQEHHQLVRLLKQ